MFSMLINTIYLVYIYGLGLGSNDKNPGGLPIYEASEM